jgi:putative tryptophan/tyrosine transport system substrate-binding protein
MRRREFITLLGGAATVWPMAARAQSSKLPLIGFLSSGSPSPLRDPLSAFHQALAGEGFVENQNVTIEYRWAEGDYTRLPSLAAELVWRPLSLIVAMPTQSALAAQAATPSVPIVFYTGGDPVELGLVTSFNRPGRNLTGVSQFSGVLGPKRLELLKELVPTARKLAVLVNPDSPISQSQIKLAQASARVLSIQLVILKARAESEIEAAVRAVIDQGANGLVVEGDSFFNSRRDKFVSVAARYEIPTVYEFREFVLGGGLCSYGVSNADAFRQVGVYAGRILKGEKATDLPVVQPTKFELAINLKAAKALTLEISPTLLARADEVIE